MICAVEGDKYLGAIMGDASLMLGVMEGFQEEADLN
jgi:hypothetical protein